MKLQFGQHEPGADGPAAEAAAADASLDSATLALPAEPINGGGRALVERAVLVTADADVPTALRSVRLPPPACRRDIRRSMKCVALLEALLSSVTPTSLVLVHVQSGSGCGGSKKCTSRTVRAPTAPEQGPLALLLPR